ncbi:MAG: CheR family methyltransferase [Limnochordia bacterium]
MDSFAEFQQRFYFQTGLDLRCYKQKQMQRRIEQWMDRHDLSDYSQLLSLLHRDKAKQEEFLNYLTINTSQFFRDTSVFKNIAELIVAPWVGKRPKIWSAGASIGAEAYTMAILLQEAGIQSYHILGTDIDAPALAKAEAGSYPSSQVQGVPPALLQKYFTSEGGDYQILPSLKRGITWQVHNLLRDPFPNGFDLILCRNVFIYFTWETQKLLLEKFCRSLRKDGFFVSGSSEQMINPEEFGLIRRAHCIYQLAGD